MKKLSSLETKVVKFLKKEKGKGIYPSTLSRLLDVRYMKIVSVLKSLETKGAVYSKKNQYFVRKSNFVKCLISVILVYLGITVPVFLWIIGILGVK